MHQNQYFLKSTLLDYYLVCKFHICYKKTSFELSALQTFFLYKKIIEKILFFSIILHFYSSSSVKGEIRCFHLGNKDREEVNKLEKSPLDKDAIRYKFCGCCYSILQNEAIDYFREIKRRLKYEALFSELTQNELKQMYVFDKYDMTHGETEHCFKVLNMDVEVNDSQIAEALAKLKAKNRLVILMAYFLDMTETEIAEYMNLKQSTIHYHKVTALKKMKKIMEKSSHEEQKKKSPATLRNHCKSSE